MSESLGFVVLTRHPAPRTPHGWTYEPLGAIFSGARGLIQAQNVHESGRGDLVIAQLVPVSSDKPAWPDLGAPVNSIPGEISARLPMAGRAAQQWVVALDNPT